MESDQTLIDKVTYTASLATHPEAISPLLTPVRIITARQDTSQPLTPAEKSELVSLQSQLEQYLVQKEPLRFFTTDSLRLQIAQHLQGFRNKKSLVLLTWTLVIAPVVAGVIMLLPVFPQELPRHIQLAITAALSLVQLGAAMQFLSALPAFRSQLRFAFQLICLGICILAIGIAEQPFIEALGFRGQLYTNTIVGFSLLCGTLPIYLGIRRYAKLVGVTQLFQSWKLPAFGLLLTGSIALVVQPVDAPAAPVLFKLAALLQGAILAFVSLTYFTARQIPARVSDLYKPAARAFVQAGAVVVILNAYMFGVRITIGSLKFPAAISAALLLLLMSLLLLRAGFIFNTNSRY